MVEENKTETRKCFLFFETLSLRKNKTMNKHKNKNILLTEIKEHAIKVRRDIIVDFGSTDNTPTIEKSYCHTTLRKINQHL